MRVAVDVRGDRSLGRSLFDSGAVERAITRRTKCVVFERHAQRVLPVPGAAKQR
jgi:hypothetical protein